MKMAKASEEDIGMTLELLRSLEDLEKGYLPSGLSGDEELPARYYEEEDGDHVVQHLLSILRKGSAFRVAFGMAVMLDPRNEVVDPDADCLEMHPKFADAMNDAERYRLLRRGQHWSVIDEIGDTLRSDDLDAAIDAKLTRLLGNAGANT